MIRVTTIFATKSCDSSTKSNARSKTFRRRQARNPMPPNPKLRNLKLRNLPARRPTSRTLLLSSPHYTRNTSPERLAHRFGTACQYKSEVELPTGESYEKCIYQGAICAATIGAGNWADIVVIDGVVD